MKLIRPTVMTQAMLVSSNAVEIYATYAGGTSYALGAIVVYGTSIYESVVAANLGNTPDASPTKWVRLGPSNLWAMFDDQVSTPTQASISLTVNVATGIIDSLAIVGVDAEKATLTVRDGAGGPIVYQQTQSVTGAAVYDWYEYFFSDATVRRTQAVFTGIPPFASSRATLEVTSAGTVTVGGMVFGRINSIGDVAYGAQAGITDYSRKDTDEFGVTSFVRRAYSKKLTCSVKVMSKEVNRVQRLLSDLRATPVIWIGTDAPEFSEPLVLYGFYRDFYCSIDYPTVSIYQLEIEGLI